MKIPGYLHVDKASCLYETTVRTWILDERIIGEIEWTPVLPGKHGDWRQHPLIKCIFAACDSGTRRLEDWVGKSSGAVNRGGRIPACRRGWGRRHRGQRRCKAARQAVRATARARGLGRAGRRARRARQAHQDWCILPPILVPHNLAEGKVMGS